MEINFPKLEKKILKHWKENKIFEKSIKRRAGARVFALQKPGFPRVGKQRPSQNMFWLGSVRNRRCLKAGGRGKPCVRNFVFYEGPPTANAKAGLHHVLARVFKDIICRYKTMRGFRVLRKAGWDTHGLPVELEIEKKLGFKSKKDIERYGIAKFNKKCKRSVWLYKKDWERLTERIGFWLDLENPYITYTSDYIETVWWILKQIWQKGFLYQDYKVVPYCPRCGTSLSSHEVALGYKKIKEPAIYVKLKVRDVRFEQAKRSRKRSDRTVPTYLLVWTTTPWTLPGNVAVAVNPKFTYVKVKVETTTHPPPSRLRRAPEFLILAKERMKACGIEGKIVQEFKGKDLLGLKYEPLFPTLPGYVDETVYFVIAGDFVSLEEGTGLVHIAPAFGEEDMQAGKENDLPILLTVDEEGKFKQEVKNWTGMFVKEADPLIVKDLRKRNLLFKEELYEHDYPFCWRCDSPLLYYAKKSWFIRMTKVKKDLIKNNQKINWIPAHLKEGRFGEWLREIKDWTLSRERFWGTPLPIWKCKNCKNLAMVGSKKDLISQKFSKNKYYFLRHGESYFQTKFKEICCGWPEPLYCPLTRRGRREVRILAKKLKKEKIDLIYSSDFLRARQTAEIVAKELGLKIIFDSRLRDINFGIFNGKKRKDLYRAFPNPLERFLKKPKKGESWSDCKMRMLGFLREIDQKHEGKNILIVSHGDPLWLLEGAMKGLSNQELLRQKRNRDTIKVQELRKIEAKFLPYDEKGNLDFHRPYVDEVRFLCPKCRGTMERVPEVIDCWFDSGAMPFGQAHWPFAWPQIKNEKLKIKNYIKKGFQFPADYISEGVDQTRGWFYTLLAISTLLGFGPAYKNVISLGHVLDEKGEKMSKSKGNVVDPWRIVEKYGADATRWYFFTVNQPGDPKLFAERDVEKALKKFIMILWNSYSFFETYVSKKKPKAKSQKSKVQVKSQNLLDQWIISKLNELIQIVTQRLDDYDVTGAARTIEDFVVGDLSQWYIRRSRKRFQRPKTQKELERASNILNFVLLTLSKLTAPLIPFVSEQIYRNLVKKQSVHLEDWPKVNRKLINKNLNQKMELVRNICSLGLKARVEAGIKVRQPIALLKILPRTETKFLMQGKNRKQFLELIKEELNVKEIIFDPKMKKEVEIDTRITPELREEGQIREVIRHIQQMRKELGLKPKHKILIQYFGSPELNKLLAKRKDFVLEETRAEDFAPAEFPKLIFDMEKKVKINREKLWLAIKKI